MNIQLSDHFTYNKLLRFTLPSIATMIFTSIYGVVDGFFVGCCILQQGEFIDDGLSQGLCTKSETLQIIYNKI